MYLPCQSVAITHCKKFTFLKFLPVLSIHSTPHLYVYRPVTFKTGKSTAIVKEVLMGFAKSEVQAIETEIAIEISKCICSKIFLFISPFNAFEMASGICKIKRQASHRLCHLNLTHLHMFFVVKVIKLRRKSLGK